jgi:glycine/D-amino acid oxidase-like deaminating enzyme
MLFLGGGIHGVSIAYYLSTRFKIAPLIIEQTEIACAASGKAGGFLARDWGTGTTVDLHVKSYNLHKELASSLHIESYREVTTLEIDGNRKGKNVASWLNGKVSSKVMDVGAAQVTSLEFTQKLLQAAINAGTEVLIDKVVGIDLDEADEKVRSVRCERSGEIVAENIVIAMGPWSCKSESSFVLFLFDNFLLFLTSGCSRRLVSSSVAHARNQIHFFPFPFRSRTITRALCRILCRR